MAERLDGRTDLSIDEVANLGPNGLVLGCESEIDHRNASPWQSTGATPDDQL
jgi:hypothetical protein